MQKCRALTYKGPFKYAEKCTNGARTLANELNSVIASF